VYIIARSAESVVENAGQGTDTVSTTLTSYTLGNNVENLTYAGGAAINGTGNNLVNIMTGAAGNDVFNGNDGNDTLIGGGGADNLSGGNGNDILNGGAGNDTMNGGGGNDVFVFQNGFGADSINGFDADVAGGQDLLDISALGISAATFAANVTITDLGVNTLVTIAGVGSFTLFGVDGNGNNVITQSDFLLGP
jgi:Ca2+-binding RTX toxin-like protein